MKVLLGRTQPVIPPNLYSMLMNWGPQVKEDIAYQVL